LLRKRKMENGIQKIRVIQKAGWNPRGKIFRGGEESAGVPTTGERLSFSKTEWSAKRVRRAFNLKGGGGKSSAKRKTRKLKGMEDCRIQEKETTTPERKKILLNQDRKRLGKVDWHQNVVQKGQRTANLNLD